MITLSSPNDVGLDFKKAIIGSLLGTAVGDSLGLPYEGLAPDRSAKLLGLPEKHRFLFGHGMTSDDTDHACMVAMSLIKSRFDDILYLKKFSQALRWWILCIPAGIGLATLRAVCKL